MKRSIAFGKNYVYIRVCVCVCMVCMCVLSKYFRKLDTIFFTYRLKMINLTKNAAVMLIVVLLLFICVRSPSQNELCCCVWS